MPAEDATEFSTPKHQEVSSPTEMKQSDSTTICEQTVVPANPDCNTYDQSQEISEVRRPITVEQGDIVKESVEQPRLVTLSSLANELGREATDFLSVEDMEHPKLLDRFLAEST